MIKHITFEEILPVWRNFLWTDRFSPIEKTSAMNFLGGHNLNNMSFAPTFFAYILNNKIVGVNSGHKCMDNSYRSRGLWVFPEYRGQHIGRKLLLATIDQSTIEKSHYVSQISKRTGIKEDVLWDDLKKLPQGFGKIEEKVEEKVEKEIKEYKEKTEKELKEQR